MKWQGRYFALSSAGQPHVGRVDRATSRGLRPRPIEGARVAEPTGPCPACLRCASLQSRWRSAAGLRPRLIVARAILFRGAVLAARDSRLRGQTQAPRPSAISLPPGRSPQDTPTAPRALLLRGAGRRAAYPAQLPTTPWSRPGPHAHERGTGSGDARRRTTARVRREATPHVASTGSRAIPVRPDVLELTVRARERGADRRPGSHRVSDVSPGRRSRRPGRRRRGPGGPRRRRRTPPGRR